MNQNQIKSLTLIGFGLFVALWLISSSLGSGRNAVGEIFKFLPIAFGVFGFIAPRKAVYGLLLCAAFIGYFKKLLVLDGHYGWDLQYMVVGAPAILLFAICAGLLARVALSPTSTKEDWALMVGFSMLSIIVMAFIYLKSRSPQLAVMAGAYVNGAWVVAILFRNPSDLRRLGWFIAITFVLSSLVGFRQWIFGLTALDLLYLEYGYELAYVDRDDPRPFATYGTSGHFGYAMLFAVAVIGALMVTAGPKERSGAIRAGQYLLLAVAIAGVFCSLKKAPIVSLACFPLAIYCARKWYVAVACLALMAGTIALLIYQGPEISRWAKDVSQTTSKIHPTLSINTINTRIRSFEQIGDSGGAIKMIGKGDVNAHSHTAITDVLLVIGYIPAGTLVILGVGGYLYYQRRLGRVLGGWKSVAGREVSLYVGFFLSFAAGSMMGTNAFQAFPGSLLMWLPLGFVALALHRTRRARKRERESKRVAAPVGRQASSAGIPMAGAQGSLAR